LNRPIGEGDDANTTDGSRCYNNDPSNCAIYGRLYDWSTAMGFPMACNSNSVADAGETDPCVQTIAAKHQGICPSGWHIPTNDDWDVLMKYVDALNDGEGTDSPPYDSENAGEHLKANSALWFSNSGTDAYGFFALPGGSYRGSSFGAQGSYGYWWSASEYRASNAYYRYMYASDGRAYWSNRDKSIGLSLRCLQD
jgi:uncharacterized protein (TIGR02145 family)